MQILEPDRIVARLVPGQQQAQIAAISLARQACGEPMDCQWVGARVGLKSRLQRLHYFLGLDLAVTEHRHPQGPGVRGVTMHREICEAITCGPCRTERRSHWA